MIHAALNSPFDVTLYHLINRMAGHHAIFDHLTTFFANDALEIYAVLFIITWFVLPKRDIELRHALVMAGLSGILALVINVVISHIGFVRVPFPYFQKEVIQNSFHTATTRRFRVIIHREATQYDNFKALYLPCS